MTIKLNSTILNVLRVFATLLVFFCHSCIIGRDEFGFELHGALWLLKTPAWGGVWMFFAMGGFLATYGFDINSYTTDKEGILKYYKSRFVKVLLPTWIFISLVYIFYLNESTLSLKNIISFITCSFNGGDIDGLKSVGATWYVFISMWLYFLTPFLYKILIWYEYKHRGKECSYYKGLLVLIVCVSIIYRCLQYLGVDYYNWMYANVLGSIDLWLTGMIGCRLLHYLPTDVPMKTIKKLRVIFIVLLFVLATVFSGWVKELGCFSEVFPLIQTGLNQIYKIGSIIWGITAISLVILYSYEEENKHKIDCSKRPIAPICNAVAPYTFMFYLWHSGLLTHLATKLTIEDVVSRYWAMLAIGFVVTVYVAFLMTYMNNGLIKHILKK